MDRATMGVAFPTKQNLVDGALLLSKNPISLETVCDSGNVFFQIPRGP